MPPRSSLTSSFSIADTNNEVTCPLRNQDGSSCRKRCVGEKKYRSMQEHIRRAHPEHYISKLPATEESFHLMINTAPSERPQPGPSSAAHQNKGYMHDSAFHRDNSSAPGTPRNPDEYPPAYLPAAAALAQLGNHNLEPEWEPEPVSHLPSPEDWHLDADKSRLPRSSIELPPIAGFPTSDPASEAYPNYNHGRQPALLPSILSGSPPGRSSTLPPLHGALKPNRSRKDSVTKKGKHIQHQKKRSKGSATDWLRRMQNDGAADRLRPGGNFSKAMSAEPSSHGTRWEDLLDAATSATEDIDEDRTPVGQLTPVIDPSVLTYQVPQSPISINRASMPPFPQQAFQSYQASPLQQALTPPTYVQELHEPFPSVESSGQSDEIFNMDARGLADSSPNYTSSHNPQIYCAACQSVSLLRQSYACTECICGLCQRCVEVLMDEQGSKRKCPRCNTINGRFKPFQLEIR